MTWDTKKVVLVGALCVALTQTGHFLTGMSWLIQSPAVAYAAKDTAEKVDDQFSRYLEGQQKVADALNAYVGQQKQQQAPANPPAPPKESPPPEPQQWTEDDPSGVCWECSADTHQECWDKDLWRKCP